MTNRTEIVNIQSCGFAYAGKLTKPRFHGNAGHVLEIGDPNSSRARSVLGMVDLWKRSRAALNNVLRICTYLWDLA